MPARTSQTNVKEHTEHEERNTPPGPKHLKGLVLAHGGELTVDTQPGHGAAFHLRLPQAETFQVIATESQDQLP
jgi:K+-sensing histidine kinase KdpD